jgi:hypothetical protein
VIPLLALMQLIVADPRQPVSVFDMAAQGCDPGRCPLSIAWPEGTWRRVWCGKIFIQIMSLSRRVSRLCLRACADGGSALPLIPTTHGGRS